MFNNGSLTMVLHPTPAGMFDRVVRECHWQFILLFGLLIKATFTQSLDCLNPDFFLDPVPFFIAFTRSSVKK